MTRRRSVKRDFFRRREEEEQEQDQRNKSFGRTKEQEEDHDKIPGSVETFTPQELRATPLSREQRSQSSQEQDLTEEGEEPDLEEGSRSSQEQTEEGNLQEPEEPGRCNVHQVKEQECREKEDPGENINNSEPNMNGEKHGKGHDQTKEEELDEPVRQDMVQKAGWLRRKGRRLRNTDNPPKDVPRADNIVFSPQVGSHKIAQSQVPESSPCQGDRNSPRLPHARETREPPDAGERGNRDEARGAQHNMGADPITHGIQTLVENMQSTQLSMDLKCCKE